MIPVWSNSAILSFQGDLIVVLYLLTIPTATFFLAGWSSVSPYSMVGAIRVITQLFAYEIPLMLVLLGPAILAGSWRISDISWFMFSRPEYMLSQFVGFVIAVICLQGKLERVPFDIPHGETEIVGGAFTEYTGRLYAMFLLTMNMEMVAGAALLNAVFLGGALGFGGFIGFVIFLVKTMLVVFLLAAMKALMARIRIEQMVNFCWKILAPLALAQIFLNVVTKG